MAFEKEAAHIQGRYRIYAAIIATVLGGLLAAFGWWYTRPIPAVDPRVTVTKEEEFPQQANLYAFEGMMEGDDPPEIGNKEIATFRFSVRNESKERVKISKIEYVQSHVKNLLAGNKSKVLRTAMFIEPIDHEGHLQIPFRRMHAEEPLSVVWDVTIEPERTKPLILWFVDKRKDDASPLDVEGTLFFITGDLSAGSIPLILTIRPDR